MPLQDSKPAELTIEPLDDYVVIHPSDLETETGAGLILPVSVENPCRTGIVVGIGPEVEGIAPGDKVLFAKDAGYEVRVAGVESRVLRRKELIARIHD
jgi:co-chaperonin GroES (HSP10)